MDTRFKKGEINNPNGRPKGSVSIVEAIKRKLAEDMPIDATNKEKRTYLEGITQKIFEKGMTGDVSMLKDMVDRVDGKSKESVEHSGIMEVVFNVSKDVGAKNGITPTTSKDSEEHGQV